LVADEVDDEVEDDGTGVAENVGDELEYRAGYELAAEDLEEAEEERRLLVTGRREVHFDFGKGAVEDELLVLVVCVGVVLVGG